MTPDMRTKLDALVAEGLDFSQMVNYFAEDVDQIAHRHYIDWAADLDYVRDGEVEVSDPGIVSFGADNGAYVLGWIWVPGENEDEDGDDK